MSMGHQATRLFVLLLLALPGVAASADAQPGSDDFERYLVIGTDPSDSGNFGLATDLSIAVSNPVGDRSCDRGGGCGVDGLVVITQSTGGAAETIGAVARGRLDTGVARAASVMESLRNGAAILDGSLARLRAIACVYPERLTVLVRDGDGARSVADLDGRRVYAGAPGTPNRHLVDHVLDAHGIDSVVAEIDPADDPYRLVRDGQLDAVFGVERWSSGPGSGPAAPPGLRWLGLEADALTRVAARMPSVRPTVLTAAEGTASVASLAVGSVWMTSVAADEDLVFAVAEALARDQTLALLGGVTAAPLAGEPDLVPGRFAVPLHAGALRAFDQLQERPGVRASLFRCPFDTTTQIGGDPLDENAGSPAVELDG
ncbi:MAG: TAXI family TRAP transporter solute-binding subunit [Inquilinaceae bacterium]